MKTLDKLMDLKENTLLFLERERTELSDAMASPQVVNDNARRISNTICEISVLSDTLEALDETADANVYEVLTEFLQDLQAEHRDMKEAGNLDGEPEMKQIEEEIAALERIIFSDLQDDENGRAGRNE